MGFRINFSLGLLACVSMYGSLAWTQADDSSHITVFVNDGVGVNRAILKPAEAEVARLFRPAGIAIESSIVDICIPAIDQSKTDSEIKMIRMNGSIVR